VNDLCDGFVGYGPSKSWRSLNISYGSYFEAIYASMNSRIDETCAQLVEITIVNVLKGSCTFVGVLRDKNML